MQNFINRNLEAKEERINKLHSEGDQLLAAEHPGRNSIEVRVPLEGMLPPGWPRGSLCCGLPRTWAVPRGGDILCPLSFRFCRLTLLCPILPPLILILYRSRASLSLQGLP